MKVVEPKVYMIACTHISHSGYNQWLKHLGVPDWRSDAPSATEELIEATARRCYRAFATESVNVQEQNPNLSRVREGNKPYLGNILKHKHGAVIEHGYVTFAFENVSRVFTHEVVRHRLCNFSQESLRFVRPTSLDTYFPDAFKDLPEDDLSQEAMEVIGDYGFEWPEDETIRSVVKKLFEDTILRLEETQKALAAILGMDKEENFNYKKLLQSSMRRLMPIGLSTGIVVTANHRTWRWLVELRTSLHAEEEIRNVFYNVGLQLQREFPNLYQDMHHDVDGVITFENSKV